MFNRNQNTLSLVVQSPIAPKSRNVLWDNGTLIKIWRKEGWVPLLGSNGEDLDLSKYLETDIAKTMFAPISIMDWYNNINEYLEYDATSSAIICKTNLIVQGDTSSGGSGSDNPGEGITFSGISYKGKHYSDFTVDNYLNIDSLVEDLDLSHYVKNDDIKGLKNWYSNTGVNIVKDGWLTVSTSGKGLQNTDISSGSVARFYFNKSDNRWHSNKSISADADLFIGSTLYANSLGNYGIGLSGADVGGVITIHEKGTWKATAIRINTDGSTKMFKNLQAVEGINVTKTENASNEGTSGVAGVFIRSEGGIELSHSSTPYIDFHANQDTEDFTIRITASVYSNGAKQLNLHGATALVTQSDANIGSSGIRWNELYCKKGDFNDSLSVLKNVTVGGNLVVAGDVSSGGNGQDIPTGIDKTELEKYLTDNGYAKQSWIIGNGYITSSALDPYQKADTAITTSNIGNQAVKYASILGSASDGYTKSQIESALDSKQATITDLSAIRNNATNGNTAYSWGNHANAGYASKTDLNGYLPIVGGRLTGALEITSGTNSRRGVLKADTSHTNNIGCLQIGVNVGDEIPIGISLVGIEPYLIANDKNSKTQGTVVGIGRAYTVDELKALCRPDSAGKMQIYGAVIDKGLLVQNGNVTISQSINTTGQSGVSGVFLRSEGGIELCHNSTPYIDFHYGNSTSDFSNRIFCDAEGIINTTGSMKIQQNLIVSGDVSSGSDMRFKSVINNITLNIDTIANAPLFTFKWNNKDDNFIHLGTSAQYWENACEGLVNGEEFKTLNYASLGVAMGISLAKRLLVLEKENNYLKEELRRIKYGC